MENKYISEFAWSKIFAFLKKQKNIYTRVESKCRCFVEAIFWIARSGAQWRELPECYGKWNTVFSRFNAWSAKQVWHNLLIYCAQEPDLEYIVIDTTIVRAHACAAGYGDPEIAALGKSKGGFTTKIHAKVDALGNPLQFIITPGQANDTKHAPNLLKNVSNSFVIADRAYNSGKIKSILAENNCHSVIPPKSNSKNPQTYDKHIYKERHVIECLFSKMKYFRHVFSRFDKSAQNFTAFLSFVGAILWLR